MKHNKKKLLITGATGFTGSYVLREFLMDADLYEISIFARSQEKVKALSYDKLPIVVKYGEFENRNSLVEAMKGKDAVINIASLGFGHSRDIVEACNQTGIKRGVFISTTSIYTKIDAASKQIRLDAEKRIRESGIIYTILRPTMIYGSTEDRNIIRLVNYLHKFRILPVFGSGENLLQPVFVADVARAVKMALETEKAENKAFNISGKDSITYNELIHITADALGIKPLLIHLPVMFSIILLKLYSLISKKPKLTVEQALRLNEDKAFSHDEAKCAFSFNPISYSEGISLEIDDWKKRALKTN